MSEAVLSVLKASGDFGLASLRAVVIARVDVLKSGTEAPILVPLGETPVPLC